MSFQEDRKKLIEYLKCGIGSSKDEHRLEEFFEFIDKLEENAKEEVQYYSLLSDACMEAGDTQKAKDFFKIIYNSKNKRDIKKLLDFDRVKAKPIVRPSRRVKILPEFKYTDKAVLINKFIISGDCSCSICKKQSVPLYVGIAYMSCLDEMSFYHRQDKFCAECINDGTAAKEFGIKFNLPLLEKCRALDINQINELLYNTPECSSEFDYNEDIWARCCGDFCRYMKQQNEYEEKFYFKCIHCGKEIVWTKEG